MALTIEGLENWYTQMVKLKCAFTGEDVPDPIPLPDVTTIDGLLEGIVNEADASLISVATNAGRLHDYDEAYALQLPADVLRWYGVTKIGGRTIMWNQLSSNNSTNPDVYTNHDVTYTFNHDDLTVTCTGTATGGAAAASRQYPAIKDHVYLMSGCPAGGGSTTYYVTTSAGGSDKGSGDIFTETTTGTRYIIFRFASGVNADGIVFHPLIFDLTKMFGAGNEPSTVAEFKEMFPEDFYPYTTGELMDIKVTSVISKDADDNVLGTIDIPAEVQALEGYGMSCPNGTNYVDLEAQKYYQHVGSRAYEAGDDSDADVVTDGTTTHYALDTPVETSISVKDYIACADGGSITFENTNKVPVPVEVRYVS